MTHTLTRPRIGATVARRTRLERGRLALGAFFVMTAGIHVGIVAADAQTYARFADGALVGFVRTGWAEIFMASPTAWGLGVAAGEALMGAALLAGGRWVRPGYVGIIGFHAALMLFGWGLWIWCIPALGLIVPMALADSTSTKEA